MLKAMGANPYKRLHVHGYWNVDETKMSKSIGNVIRPTELVELYGVDTVRYFVLKEMSFGLDASFSNEVIIERQNSDLANDLGNLFSRALTMIGKYADNTVPKPYKGLQNDLDRELINAIEHMVSEYRYNMDSFNFNRALQEVWKVIGMMNRFIVTNAPWELAKDPDQEKRLMTVLYFLAESLRIIALVLRPVMPTAAAKMAEALGLGDEMENATLDTGRHWGTSKPGTQIVQGQQLFPRLDKKKKQAPQPQQKAAGKKKKEPEPLPDGLITFDQFGKLELRVAEIIAAEKIAKADKLIKLTVKAPEERTIVAGIAKHYTPEELIGRLVLVVANLKPAKLMGVKSQGMVLAAKEKDADGNERLVLATVSDTIAPGSKIS